MTFSIAALLSAIHSNAEPGHASVCTMPWAEWGPAATCILLNIHGARLLKLVGPFWITGLLPVMYRDYDMLRARCMWVSVALPSSLSCPTVCPLHIPLF
jgi:hypothetical protein